MIYFYLVASAALIPILNNFYNILRQPNSWWLIPVLYILFVILFIVLHLAFVCVCVLLVNLNKDGRRFSKFYRVLANTTLPLLFKLARIKVHTAGLEKVPSDTRFLLVCNHIHNFDPAVIIHELPDAKLGFIAKKEVYTDLRFIAKFMHKLNCLPIDRENNREAVKTIVKAVSLIKNDVASVGIFPEGYTSKDGNLQPLRNGALKIAFKANVPIVVCTIYGTTKIIKNMFRRKTDVYLDIVDVIGTKEFEKSNTSEIGNKVYDLMKESLNNRKNI